MLLLVFSLQCSPSSYHASIFHNQIFCEHSQNIYIQPLVLEQSMFVRLKEIHRLTQELKHSAVGLKEKKILFGGSLLFCLHCPSLCTPLPPFQIEKIFMTQSALLCLSWASETIICSVLKGFSHTVSLMLLSIIETSASSLAFCLFVQMVSCTHDTLFHQPVM